MEIPCMARKTKEESQRTRDRILDAAEHVFLSKGVASTTMSDIADHAGYPGAPSTVTTRTRSTSVSPCATGPWAKRPR